jgi:hypothetical protein
VGVRVGVAVALGSAVPVAVGLGSVVRVAVGVAHWVIGTERLSTRGRATEYTAWPRAY